MTAEPTEPAAGGLTLGKHLRCVTDAARRRLVDDIVAWAVEDLKPQLLAAAQRRASSLRLRLLSIACLTFDEMERLTREQLFLVDTPELAPHEVPMTTALVTGLERGLPDTIIVVGHPFTPELTARKIRSNEKLVLPSPSQVEVTIQW